MSAKLLTEHHLEFLKRMLHRLIGIYTFQKVMAHIYGPFTLRANPLKDITHFNISEVTNIDGNIHHSWSLRTPPSIDGFLKRYQTIEHIRSNKYCWKHPSRWVIAYSTKHCWFSVDPFCYLCFMFVIVILSYLFLAVF